MLSACGSTTSPTASSSQPSVLAVAITGTFSLTSAGQTSQLTATAALSDATVQNVTGTATWSSSSPAIATVSAAGLVTAVGSGTATISVSYQGKTASVGVTVTLPQDNSAFVFLAGNWAGTWTDTRYNVSGTLQATFTVNGTTVNATGVIGLASLGLGNEPGTGTGTISGQALNFTFTAATVGSGSGVLAGGGQGTGSGTVAGVLNFGPFTFSGTAAKTTISGTFQFTSPTGGNGVASLTKQ